MFKDYQSFSDETVTEESLPAYVRAKKKLEEYLPFENDLVRKETDNDVHYLLLTFEMD